MATSSPGQAGGAGALRGTIERLAVLPEPLPAPADALMSGPRRTRGPGARPGRRRPTVLAARPAVLALLYPDADGADRVVLIERSNSATATIPVKSAFPVGQAGAGRRRRHCDRTPRGNRGGRASTRTAAGVRIVGLLESVLDPDQRLRGHARRRSSPRVDALSTRHPLRRPHRRAADRGLPSRARRSSIVERTVRDCVSSAMGAHEVEGSSVWGATARILSQLGAILDRSRCYRRAGPARWGSADGLSDPDEYRCRSMTAHPASEAPKDPFEAVSAERPRSHDNLIATNSGNLHLPRDGPSRS